MTTEEVLIKCGIAYEDKGNRLAACCPYHSEKTPSFSIYKDGGRWICFGCGKKGTLSDLLYDMTGERGEWKPEYVVQQSTTVKKDLRLVDYTLEGDVLNVFDNKRVLEYCWSIGLSNAFIEEFDVTYFKKLAFLLDSTHEPKYYYNRIMIPCKLGGEVYNYECRDFTRRSSAKVLYPSRAENDFLFNYDNIDPSKDVIVVEGIKGLAKVWSYYSKNVVSTFGRALKPNQREQLCTLPHVVRLIDNDENKIDSKTGLPVDNIATTIDEMDSFYPEEYSIARIPWAGQDPNNLTIGQLQDVLEGKRNSVEFLLDGMFTPMKSSY